MGNHSTRDRTIYSESDVQSPRRPFNGAMDALFVDHGPFFRCTALYLGLRKRPRYYGMDLHIKLMINGREIPGISIKLSRISGQNGKDKQGVPSLRLSDDENRMIFEQLRQGRNKITFYIEDHPDSKIDARIYRWKFNTSFIVVDIDGTVTRSNLRGLYFCYMEEHYLRPGVSDFLLYLKGRGYQLIYLTARPISSIGLSRNYLTDDFQQFWEQKGTKLPDGPIFTSCDSHFRCALNFVGDKVGLGGISHYDFKARSLENLFRTFSLNPQTQFVAGLGNSKEDARSYRYVRIPENRIFNIAKKGKIRTCCGQKFKSYGDLLLSCRSNGTFPSLEVDGDDDFFGHIQDRIWWLNWIQYQMPPGYHESS